MKCQNCGEFFRWDKRSALKSEVIKLHQQGMSCRKIADAINNAVSFSTVSRYILEHKNAAQVQHGGAT